MVDYETCFSSGNVDLPESLIPVTLVDPRPKLYPLVESYKIDRGSHNHVVLEFFNDQGAVVLIDNLRHTSDLIAIRVAGFRFPGPVGWGIRARVITVNPGRVAQVYVDGRHLAPSQTPP